MPRKSASKRRLGTTEIFMTGYVWNLSGTDRRCDSYGRGHRIHWIHFNHSMREPSVVIPVTAVLDDDGLVNIGGDDLSLVRWNHRPTLVRDALQRFGGMAEWRNGSHAGTSSGPHGRLHGKCAHRIPPRRPQPSVESATSSAPPTPPTWFPACRLRRMCCTCG